MMCNFTIQNHIFMNFCLLLVEIEYEFSFKWYLLEKYDTKHFNSKLNFSILRLFLAEVSMIIYLKDTLLRNMTHNTSIQNQTFSFLCLILAEISMRFHSKNNSLRNMTHNTSNQNQHFSILCLFLAEIRMKFNFKGTALKNMTHYTSIQNQNS